MCIRYITDGAGEQAQGLTAQAAIEDLASIPSTNRHRWGWRAGSGAHSAECSARGPGFHPQHSYYMEVHKHW